jgi:hypothetical protein
MAEEIKWRLIKQLESLVAFQAHCLEKGDWEAYDLSFEQVKKIERELVYGE